MPAVAPRSRPIEKPADLDPGDAPDPAKLAHWLAGRSRQLPGLPRGGVTLAVALVIVAGAFLLGQAFSGMGEEQAQPTRRFTPPTGGGEPCGPAHRPPRHLARRTQTSPLAQPVSGASLWLQPLDRHEPAQIDGTEGARDVFWSPDSNFVGFLTNRGVGKVALRGLTVTMLSEDANLLHASAAWSADGQSILLASYGARVMLVPAQGGAPKAVARRGTSAEVDDQRSFVDRDRRGRAGPAVCRAYR